MCLDNIEEIGAAVEAAKKAKAELDRFEVDASDPEKIRSGSWDIKVTCVEARLILSNRIAAAEQALKDLGFRGPLAKAAPADSAETTRVLNAR